MALVLTINSWESNIFRSIHNYLSRVKYTKGGNTKRLTGFYSGLNFGIGFPDDIIALSLPHIAIVNSMVSPSELVTIGKEYYSEPYLYSLFGFAGGEGSHGLNELQKFDLRNDVKELFSRDVVIIIYDYSTDTSLGTISNDPRLTLTESQLTGYLPPIKHNNTYFPIINEVAADGNFTDPGSLSAGTVEWSLATSNLNFSSADLTSYSGQTIYEHLRSNSVKCKNLRAEDVSRGETENEKHRFLITFTVELLKV